MEKTLLENLQRKRPIIDCIDLTENGPIPSFKLPGLLPMPFNSTGIKDLFCVGDSCFPGQGLNAVAFSGFACAHRVGADLGINPWALPE